MGCPDSPAAYGARSQTGAPPTPPSGRGHQLHTTSWPLKSNKGDRSLNRRKPTLVFVGVTHIFPFKRVQKMHFGPRQGCVPRPRAGQNNGTVSRFISSSAYTSIPRARRQFAQLSALCLDPSASGHASFLVRGRGRGSPARSCETQTFVAAGDLEVKAQLTKRTLNYLVYPGYKQSPCIRNFSS